MERQPKSFPLDLPVHYPNPERPVPLEVVSGRTLEISSSELTFIAERLPPIGQSLQVFIDWPVLLDGDVKLQLVISGIVVEAHGTTVSLRIHRHDFRTRGLRQWPGQPPILPG